MDLALSEEQVALQDSTRTLLAKAFPTAQVRACEIAPRTAMAAYNKLDAHGLGGLLVPEVHGGVGLGAVEMVVVQIELGRALVPALYTDSTVVAATALLTAANPEFAAVIEGIASGQIKLACALGCSEDTLPVFVERGGRRVLEGRVGFVTEAELADWLLVAARDETGGAMLCLIKSDAVRLALVSLANLADQDMANIVFDGVLDVRVIASGDAALRAIAASDRALKLAMAAQAVGGAEQVFSLARDYACTREQFGQPIGAFQAIAHMLADGAVNIAGASMLVHRAAAALDGSAAGGEASPDCWIDMAKLKACQVFRDVSAMAIQVHGGIGFTLEAAPQLYFRRAKHLQLMHGEPLDLMTTIGATVLAGDHRMLDSNG